MLGYDVDDYDDKPLLSTKDAAALPLDPVEVAASMDTAAVSRQRDTATFISDTLDTSMDGKLAWPRYRRNPLRLGVLHCATRRISCIYACGSNQGRRSHTPLQT